MSSSQNEPNANFLCFHADILDRVCFSYQYFRQGSIFMLRKVLDRVGFEHQVGTYPYENDLSTRGLLKKSVRLQDNVFQNLLVIELDDSRESLMKLMLNFRQYIQNVPLLKSNSNEEPPTNQCLFLSNSCHLYFSQS